MVIGKHLSDKDVQPADDLALLAVNALVSAWTSSRKRTSLLPAVDIPLRKSPDNQAYLHQALVILEYGSKRSKYNFQFRVLAIRIYRLLGTTLFARFTFSSSSHADMQLCAFLSGANGLAVAHYRLLDVKQVQCDTLSHLIVARASTFSLASIGDLCMMQECIGASEIYTQNQADVRSLLFRGFRRHRRRSCILLLSFIRPLICSSRLFSTRSTRRYAPHAVAGPYESTHSRLLPDHGIRRVRGPAG